MFYEELKEFFNAVGVEKLLEQVRKGQTEGKLREKIDKFLEKKAKNQIDGTNIEVVTELREQIRDNVRKISKNVS